MTDALTRAFENIKSFHGSSQDNSRDWCDRTEIIFNAFNINDADRLARIGIKLEDAAFDWYRDNQGPYATWITFRQKLQQAFPPPERTQNPHLLAEQINQRKQESDESVHDYYYALDKLCREYDPQMSAIDKTIKLVGGLREELKEKILPLNVQTPEQFMIQAKNFESSAKVMAHHRKSDKSSELPEPTYVFESNDYSTIAASQPRQQHHQSYYKQIPQPYYHQHHQQNYRTQQQIQNRYNQISGDQRTFRSTRNQQQTTIHKSHPQQHGAKSSNNYQQMNNYVHQNVNRRKCFKCGQTDHVQNNCPHHLNY
ncbi:unnamed protein product [Rotaria sp. Silwood1]|nr:unnamed protein product [Rotaria sp. Silwood1]CAF1681742.1 unnamed protein product [Rotaria sp. Silwood1]CAF3828917.1 unnamed protein product [Rotaria sp. Silwood1]CAF4851486.1 unnamed protein product [Rotaria sp. Silwood1]CAF5032615.1 unnamed protein product [Rotaria sp. Silwood1]